MNILFLGDIVGKPGRNIVFKYLKELKEKLPVIRQKENIDFVIVNSENVAEGMGIIQRENAHISFVDPAVKFYYMFEQVDEELMSYLS